MNRVAVWFILSSIFLTICSSLAQAQDMLGHVQTYLVQEEDTLYDVARRYGLGTEDIFRANPEADRWQPEPLSELILPTAFIPPDGMKHGIVINRPELRLYYFPPEGVPLSFPVSLGRRGNETPLGTTSIVRKREYPVWTPPESIRAEKPDLPETIPPGSNNPLGDYAMSLGWPNFVIHGTNRPWSIGQSVSHGCIRMYPEHIARLFALVKVGTPVVIIDQPVSLGWQGSELYMDVHPLGARITPEVLQQWIASRAGSEAERLDWQKIDREIALRSGIPIQITMTKE